MALTKVDQTMVSDQVLSRKNLIINGDMRVAQRGTSATLDQDDDGYNVCDRFYYEATHAGGITMSQSTDVPTGEGFVNSTKIACSTADTSVAAGDYLIVGYHLEGKDVQQLKYGTSSAESLTLSFWVKGNASATYVAEFINQDTSPRRSRANTFSVTSSWSKVEITISGDTASGKTFDNDTTSGFGLFFWLMAGSTYSGGTLHTGSWQDMVNATAFDHRSFGTELQACLRYFERANYPNLAIITLGHAFGTSSFGPYNWTTMKRGTPSLTPPTAGQSTNTASWLTESGGYPSTTGTFNFNGIGTVQARINGASYSGLTNPGGTSLYSNGNTFIDVDAEIS